VNACLPVGRDCRRGGAESAAAHSSRSAFSRSYFLCVSLGLRQNAVRISQVKIFGPPSLGSSGGTSAEESFSAEVMRDLQGNYLGIIPRNSIFFFPEARIRSDLLAAHPEVAAVSVSKMDSPAFR